MRRLDVKRKVEGGKDSRNRPIHTYETLEGYLKAVSIAPLESSEIVEMNLQSATASFAIDAKGNVDITTDDLVIYQGKDFNVISVKKFTESHNRLKITNLTISYTGGAL